MLSQKQKKDNLTTLEIKIYAVLCYGSIGISLVCLFWNGVMEIERTIILVVEFVVLAVAAIFGFAIKHDARVLDLRTGQKKKSFTNLK
jgi:dolichyl-phosphate-mannose--protein O-mannosyl transferase